MKAKAVFFDRDGTLNVDVNYLYKIEDLRWTEDALAALAYLHERGYLVFVVTNQSGIARGYYSVAAMNELHGHMRQDAERAGGAIEKFYYCPHYKEGALPEYSVDCGCRKPKPGLLLQAFAEYELDKDACFMVGDSGRDIEAAHNAGIRGYKYERGSLLAFVKNIVEN